VLRTAPPDPADLRRRIYLWAAYQERSPHEVRRKLREWACPHPQAERLLEELEDEGYVNEERFVRLFVGSKFRQKQWGRRKIAAAIQAHHVPTALVADALQTEIPPDDYAATLHRLIARKSAEYAHESPAALQRRVTDYLLQKGYEYDAIADALSAFISAPSSSSQPDATPLP